MEDEPVISKPPENQTRNESTVMPYPGATPLMLACEQGLGAPAVARLNSPEVDDDQTRLLHYHSSCESDSPYEIQKAPEVQSDSESDAQSLSPAAVAEPLESAAVGQSETTFVGLPDLCSPQEQKELRLSSCSTPLKRGSAGPSSSQPVRVQPRLPSGRLPFNPPRLIDSAHPHASRDAPVHTKRLGLARNHPRPAWYAEVYAQHKN
jgi:hypothetical protein